jgi:tetratricopeptide (TPR) repeat protein
MIAQGRAVNRFWSAFRLAVLAASVFLLGGFLRPAETSKTTIDARVVSVAPDKSTLVINRGKNERVVQGSPCIIRANRGNNEADIEWDVTLAKGTVQSVGDSTSVVKLTDVWLTIWENIQPRDYCSVEADIPLSLWDLDLGRIALQDFTFLDLARRAPIFTLADLVRDPSPKAADAILDRLLAEIHAVPAPIIAEKFPNEPIRGGQFNGLTYEEAFRRTTRRQVEQFIELAAWLPGRYINYDWLLVDVYGNWASTGTPSGEGEKRSFQAKPAIQKGDDLLAKGEFAAALDEYRSALLIDPDNGGAKTKLQTVNRVLERMRILQEDAKDVTARHALGLDLFSLGLYARALDELQQAKELGDDSPEVRCYIGFAHVSLDHFSEAKAVLEPLVSEFPQDEDVRWWLDFVRQNEIVARNGSNVASLLALGKVMSQYGKYDDAIEYFNKALGLAPHDQAITQAIARAIVRRRAKREEDWAAESWNRGEYDKAVSHWKAAGQLCQAVGDVDAMESIARTMGSRMYDAGFYDIAIKAHQAILSVDPDRAANCFEIARCYERKKDYAEAARWAQQGLEKDPKSAYGFNILGIIWENAGKTDQAIVNYQKAVDIEPSFSAALYNLGECWAKHGDYEKARDFLRRALEANLNNSAARGKLISVESLLDARETLRASPESSEARFRIVLALFDLQDYEGAMAFLKETPASPEDAAWAKEQLGYCLIRLGEYPEGKSALEEAFRLRPKPDIEAWIRFAEAQILLLNNPKDPEAYILLGQDSLYWESYDQALSYFAQAEKRGANEDTVSAMRELARKGQEANKQLSTAVEYYDRAQYEKALECGGRSVMLYRELHALRGEINALLRVGWSQAAQFRHEAALRAYDDAGKLAAALGDDRVEARYLHSLADYHSHIGEYDKALEIEKRAGELWHRNNALLDEAWSFLPALGVLRIRFGDFAGELECYEKALTINRTLLYPWGEASNLLALGSVYEWGGDFSKAIESYMQALAIAQKRDIKESALNAYSGLALIYRELGDVENARKYLQYYLDSAQAQGLKSERASALNEFGLLYLDRIKDYGKALSYFEESLSLARLTGYRALEGVATGNVGVAYARQGKYREALVRQDEGLRIVREIKAQDLEMQGLNLKGETHYSLKEYDLALDCQIKAREIAAFFGARSEQWQYELEAGKIYEAKGDATKAVESYENAAETLKGIKNRITNEKLLKDFSEQEKQTDVYKRLIALLLKSGRTEEAFRYIEESKSKIVKDAFGNVKPAAEDPALKQTLIAVDKVETKKEAIEGEIQKEKQKPADSQDAKKLEILTSTLATTEGEFNQWMMKLKFQNRKIYDALSIKPAELADVQRQIPAGAVFLEYFISPDQLYILCIGQGLFRAESAAIAETDLTTAVNRFVRLCQEPPSGGTDKVLALGKQLYKDLVAPVEDVVDRYETVVIVPFGVLYYLPFQALVKETDGKAEYLIERKRICYTTSATFADILKNQSHGVRSLMAFGNPDGSLPAAAEEVRTLRDRIFKADATVLVSKDATKEAFLRQAKDFNILHLATHGVIEANPLESYLLFAGPTKESQELTLLEVAGYTALRAKNSLVFLSACQTAKEAGKAGTGSELITLAEAFAMAGAPTLIATLWEVEENSTRQLALTFYDELINKKKDKLDALRAGQIALIRSAEYSHPFFWAPFIMIGSWR